MSYFETTPTLGIGTGIGMQAFADIIEYNVTAGQTTVKKRARSASSLGACCSSCARGERNCGAMSGLGAVLQSTLVAQPVRAPATSPIAGGGSLVKKLLVLGLVGGGGYLAYRKFIKKA